MKNPSTDEATAIAQTEFVATTRSSSSAKPTAPKTWAVTEGKLEIDIRGERIESTIKNARFDPNGEVTLDDGTYFSGNIEAGRVTVDGTLIVGVGASVTATKVWSDSDNQDGIRADVTHPMAFGTEGSTKHLGLNGHAPGGRRQFADEADRSAARTGVRNACRSHASPDRRSARPAASMIRWALRSHE